jgi:hypothetical protein
MCLRDVSNANQTPGNEGKKAVTEVPDVPERFESHFPNTCGEWESEKDISHEPLYKRDRVRNVARLFRNRDSGNTLIVAAVYGRPRDVVDYDALGVVRGRYTYKGDQRRKIELAGDRYAEVYAAQYQKNGQDSTMHITYGGEGTWFVPRIARIDLAERQLVLKVCIVSMDSRLPPKESPADCDDLLSELLPQLDEALQSEQPSRSHGTLIAPQTVPSGSFAAEPSDGAVSR